MTSAEAVTNSIEQLYDAFAAVPKPLKIDGCPCCVEGKNVDVLLVRPLREIASDVLSSYSASAFLTIGDDPDYLYFLPRILEITATDTGWWPSPEVTGRAISNTNPLQWPEHRLQAFMNYLQVVFEDYLQGEDSGFLIDPWLCFIGRAGLDVKPFLSRLESFPAQVISYYEQNANELQRMKLHNAFWESKKGAFQDILTWFGNEAVSDILFNAYGVIHYWEHERQAKL